MFITVRPIFKEKLKKKKKMKEKLECFKYLVLF